MTATKERPILFNGVGVRAILAGKKTQTRRVITPQPEIFGNCVQGRPQPITLPMAARPIWTAQRDGCWLDYSCPYGTLGDRLWVKETWRIASLMYDDAPIIQYRVDGAEREGDPIDGPGTWDDDKYLEWCQRQWGHMATDCAKAGIEADAEGIYDWTTETNPNRWRSGRFMPRWAARILLEVTGMRVERVQDISPGDALSEGVEFYYVDRNQVEVRRRAFANLWDSLNAKRGFGWDTNPWVWVVEFKVLEPGGIR